MTHLRILINNKERYSEAELKTNGQFKLNDHSFVIQTNALNPVIDLPTMRELISLVPS